MTYTIEQRAGFPTLIGPNTTRQATNAEVELIAEVERLRKISEIANQCAANGGYLCSRDLIELRELLKK